VNSVATENLNPSDAAEKELPECGDSLELYLVEIALHLEKYGLSALCPSKAWLPAASNACTQ
tara:strand:+ start:423 stop:608 length:186 start_codon:yes stop_codon:yes gene_type:complete